MDNIQKYVYMICFTGYMREQSKLAKDAGAEEFKLTGGKCKYKNCSRYDIVLDCISDRIFYVAFNPMIESVIYIYQITKPGPTATIIILLIIVAIFILMLSSFRPFSTTYLLNDGSYIRSY